VPRIYSKSNARGKAFSSGLNRRTSMDECRRDETVRTSSHHAIKAARLRRMLAELRRDLGPKN
jgi:hypothetical protein